MFLPVRESLRRLGHRATRALTSLYLYFPSHQSCSLKSLPIGTPKARMVSPSGVQLTTMSSGAFLGCFRRLPRRRPSRLVEFSSIEVAVSKMPRIERASSSSPGLRMRVVSSAYWEIRWRVPWTVTPCRCSLLWNMRVSGSVIRRNRSGERGHPCATPPPMLKGCER
eukprot:7387813-Prymnesium_polylepis.2